MRNLKIKISKAAYDRFTLMSNPLDLPLPFDVDRIAPFGMRVLKRREEKAACVLTYKGRDIGVLDSHFNGEMSVKMIIPESAPVDAKITQVLTIIREHLDSVGRALAEAKRNDPNRKTDAQLKKEEEERVNAERVAEATRRRAEKVRADELALREKALVKCMGFAWERENEPPSLLTGITPDDMKMLSDLKLFKDRLKVSRRSSVQKTWAVTTYQGAEWVYAESDGEMMFTSTSKDNPFLPDSEKLTAELVGLRDRNLRAQDPERIRVALAQLPAAEYAADAFLFVGEKYYTWPQGATDVAEGVQLEYSRSAVTLSVDDLEIAKWAITLGAASGACVTGIGGERVPKDILNTPEIVASIGSLWLVKAAESLGIDPEPYKILSFAELEDDAETLDLGYTF